MRAAVSFTNSVCTHIYIFDIKHVQQVFLWIVCVTSSHGSNLESERSVVIGQWEVLWNKQPVQKGARGHVEFPKF